MKPTPAPKPLVAGLYWVKFARRTWISQKGWCWDEPQVDGWEVVAFKDDDSELDCLTLMDSDEGGSWNDSGAVVVEVSGPILDPDGKGFYDGCDEG